MERVGVIDIAFREHLNDITYYDVKVQIKDKSVDVILPRYHTFLGWVEVFGLPPQNEWAVLDNINDFNKTATLGVDGRKIIENVSYASGEHSHCIETLRQDGDREEKSIWKQDYKNAPDSILNEIKFIHNEGKYAVDWETKILETETELSEEELEFVTKIKNKHGEPDVLLRKSLTASGNIPPTYYSLFPIQDLLDLSEVSGSIIEMGYLKKDSPHKVDNVHGNWYKRFALGDHCFYIDETNYSSREIETESGPERIKDTYRKELFID